MRQIVFSKQRKKRVKSQNKEGCADKDDVLTLNNQAKTNKSEILVLDQMIEQNIKTNNLKKLNDYTVRELFQKIYRKRQ